MRLARKTEQKKIAKLENSTTGIVYYGLWQSEEQIDSTLARIQTVTEKKRKPSKIS